MNFLVIILAFIFLLGSGLLVTFIADICKAEKEQKKRIMEEDNGKDSN